MFLVKKETNCHNREKATIAVILFRTLDKTPVQRAKNGFTAIGSWLLVELKLNFPRYYDINAVRALEKVIHARQLLLPIKSRHLTALEQTPEEALISAARDSQDVLIEAKTVFPFVLFPDSICVDREKLTITHRTFFGTADIKSVNIRDILSVQAKVGPFFGSLILSSKYFINNVQTISSLSRKDVLRFQRLIQGSLIVAHKGIDISNVEKEQLIMLLTDLGEGNQ